MLGKLIVLGGDGYLGFPTSIFFSNLGWEVTAVDNLSKRLIEGQSGISPLIDLPSFQKRFKTWNELNSKNPIREYVIDIAKNNKQLYQLIDHVRPDAIIHFAEQPSAPYSMKGREEAIFTQSNNISGTLNLIFAIQKYCPDCHIVKLGTMGEYGTPNIDIEEGWLDVNHNNRTDRVLFPKKPGSFYHLSKVHDSNNLEYACRTWGLRVTDLNQGIVYGSHTELTKIEGLHTSFHYDSIFGTAINRFILQGLVNSPLTIYGGGLQERAYLNINDVLQCLKIALENPAKSGEFKVRNQFTEFKSINDLAKIVKESLAELNIDSKLENIENPRVEEEKHYYNPNNKSFIDLGLKPVKISKEVILEIAKYLLPYVKNYDPHLLMPNINWNMNKK